VNSFKDFAKDRLKEDVQIHFAQPLAMPDASGQPVPAFGDRGTLLQVFEDGFLIRTNESERFYQWSRVGFLEFPSKVALS